MKILMTADSIGGVWTYAVELAKAFQAYDIEVHLACMGKSLSENQLQQVGAFPIYMFIQVLLNWNGWRTHGWRLRNPALG